MVAPWVGFNLARFHDPTFISTNDGITLAGANCDADVLTEPGSGSGRSASCTGSLDLPGDQSQVVEPLPAPRRSTTSSTHKSRVPIVVLARVGRTWSLFRPLDMVSFNAGEDRERWVTRLGLVAYYPTLLVRDRRRGGAVAAAAHGRAVGAAARPLIVVTIGAVITYGQTRFRAARRAVARGARRGRRSSPRSSWLARGAPRRARTAVTP